jgi:D-beta-D-heptose 7-phosphate kinase/D-beta-D-heptose 1-phosphate adenosyltransferase
MLDVYVTGTASRLCQEAPVPVVSVCRSGEAPGGAANVAANAVALGARVRLLSVVGDDDEGRRLTRLLKARGIGGDGLVVEPGRRTLTKMRVMAADHMLVRVDQGTTSGMDAAAEARLIELLPEAFASCDVAVVSDYGYGVLTRAVLRALGSLQGAEPRVLGVDAKDLGRYRGMDVTVVKPNHAQALALLGRPEPASGANRARWMLQQGEPLLDACSAHVVAVTLDSEGALVFERGRSPYRTYARPHAQVQAAGAGDTFLTALTLSLGTGADVPSAAELASAAAAVVMGKEGTATCSAGEVREAISAGGKVLAPEHVVARMDSHRSQGRRIVFTNGCFDILHRGHTTYLNRAKSLGDVLVVGVNDDAGVRRLKGSGRPVNPLEDRIEVLAALSCVDHVVAFEEPEPSRLIRQVRPHVFVKGGDYTRDRLPEAAVVEELGGRVEILPYERDRSTTGVIERIRRSPGGVVPVPDPEPSPAG